MAACRVTAVQMTRHQYVGPKTQVAAQYVEATSGRGRGGGTAVRTLAIDIETYCEAELDKVGQYTYAQDPTFEILLFAYAFDDDEVRVVDLAQGETIPDEVLQALQDPNVLKTAWNAAFE